MGEPVPWEDEYKNKTQTKLVWWTKDIAIASFMAIALGKTRHLGTEPIRGNGRMRYFIFEDRAQSNEKRECESLKEDYLFERPITKVIARQIMDQFRAFRSLGYQ